MTATVESDTAAGATVATTVNGHELRVPAGLTILRALTDEGIDIPSLCHDIRLERSNASCGLCVVEVTEDGRATPRDVKACLTPVREGMVITTHSPRLEAYRKVRLEQLLTDHNADCVAPCVQTCPANVDIQTYLRRVGDGNFEAALRVIKDRNPFPSVCGRVCPHPCEAACRRNLVDSAVAINHVKRFAADWDTARETPWIPRITQHTGRQIAVVGAGPSGLSAAYYAALAGHSVTVFEKQRNAGGMMRYGIPEYRLPKAALDKEIGVIQAMGVQIVTGTALGVHITLEDLRRDFDAVYLAIGSWRATPLRIDGDNLDGVWLGIKYLERITKGDDIPLGRTVVIGGGNTAIDCARTALRKGAEHVTLVYRRGREEMPAEPYEVEEAEAEGVEMMYLVAPDGITNHHGRHQADALPAHGARRAGPLRPAPPDPRRGQRLRHRGRHDHRRDRPEHRHRLPLQRPAGPPEQVGRHRRRRPHDEVVGVQDLRRRRLRHRPGHRHPGGRRRSAGRRRRWTSSSCAATCAPATRTTRAAAAASRNCRATSSRASPSSSARRCPHCPSTSASRASSRWSPG